MRKRNFFAGERRMGSHRPAIIMRNYYGIWPTWRMKRGKMAKKGKAPHVCEKIKRGEKKKEEEEGGSSCLTRDLGQVCVAYSRYVYYSPSPLLFSFFSPLAVIIRGALSFSHCAISVYVGTSCRVLQKCKNSSRIHQIRGVALLESQRRLRHYL